MVCLAGFEPTTTSLEGRCSIQLSYRHKTEDPALEANTSSDKGKGISTNSRLKFQGIKSPPPSSGCCFFVYREPFPVRWDDPFKRKSPRRDRFSNHRSVNS